MKSIKKGLNLKLVTKGPETSLGLKKAQPRARALEKDDRATR